MDRLVWAIWGHPLMNMHYYWYLGSNIHLNSLRKFLRTQNQNLQSWATLLTWKLISNFTQLHSLTTISNSSNHNFELNRDFQLACLSMLMLIINPDITSMCTDACKGKVCEVTRFFRSVAGDELMKLKLGVPRSRTGTGLMVLGGGPGLQSFWGLGPWSLWSLKSMM